MNKTKSTGLYRLILAIVLITLIVAIVGIAVDGWQQSIPSPEPSTPDGQTPSTPSADTTDDEPEQTPPAVYIPAYTNYLTGLETTAELTAKHPLALALHTGTDGYGLSYASVVIEFPLENGETRLLAFMEDTTPLGQIGSVAPSRTYIADMLRSFGGLLVSYGSDDRLIYDGYDTSGKHLDLMQKNGASYAENITDVYTNGYLLSTALSGSLLATERYETPSIPFRFVDFGSSAVLGATETASIYLPYSLNNTTKFVYNESKHTYTLYKNDQAYTDRLKQGDVGYTNVFVLFADTTTYERADMTQTVMDTIAGGTGYYLTEGTSMRITWKTDADGVMHMYDAAGRELTVNRGTSYISFFKSSLSSSIHFG
ncbi:MAG: DUF3048 C-terminal domain-containing protein [Clostridia bacterium]|nr:DUF3048 C-terminal domain-containing protein [Clostridia bacterium]